MLLTILLNLIKIVDNRFLFSNCGNVYNEEMP
jgi:hypothetical protein